MVEKQFNIYSEYQGDPGRPGDDPEDIVPAKLQQTIQRSFRSLTKAQLNKMYNNSNGVFRYTLHQRDKRQTYEMNIRNSADALIFSKMIFDPSSIDITKLNQGHLNILGILNHSGNGVRVFNMFANELNKWFQPVHNGRVLNPTTNRYLKADGRTAKRIFGKILLRSVINNYLPNVKINDYEIEECCVPSFFKTQINNLGKKRYNLLMEKLQNKTPTVCELSKILKDFNVGHKFYDYFGTVMIDEPGALKSGYKFMAHNSHLYVFTGAFINTTKKVIELNELDYEGALIEFKEYDKIDKTENSFSILGTKYKKIIDEFPNEFDSLGFQNSYTMINVDFWRDCGIRPVIYCKKGDKGTTIDINNAYPNTMKNKNKCIIVQTGDEWIEPYDDGKIEDHYFYMLEETIKPIYANWVPGFSLNRHKWHKMGNKILYVMKGTRHTTGKDLKFDLSEYHLEHKTVEEELNPNKSYTDHLYRLYNGMCCKHINTTKTDVSVKCEIEKELYIGKYGNEITVDKEMISFDKPYFKQKCGYFAWLSVVSHTNDDLYQLYTDVEKTNKGVKIMRMYTDSITFNKKINFDFNTSILYKEELNEKRDFISSNKSISNYDHMKYMKRDVTIVDDVFDEGAVMGYPGLGKSFYCKNVIMPRNHKMLMSSSTKENAKSWDTLNIHQYMKKTVGLIRMLKDLKGVTTICIDEASQMTKYTFFILQYIQQELKIKYIFIGDANQCPSSDGDNINTHFFKQLTNYKVKMFITWHDKARFTKEYFDFLVEFLKLNNKNDIKKFLLKSKINKVKKSETKINICYNNKNNVSMIDFYLKYPDAETVHISQGKTIEEDFTIHQIMKMEKRVAYTALSRAEGFHNVFLCL